LTPPALPKQWYTYKTLSGLGSQNLYGVLGSNQMVTMLKHGRVKLIATEDVTLKAELASGVLTPQQVQAHVPFMRFAFYIALSPQTAPAVMAEWQRQLDGMRHDGSFDAIFHRWLPTAELPPAPK